MEPENDGHQDLEPEKEKHPENDNRSQALDQDLEPEKEKHPENDETNQALDQENGHQDLEPEKNPQNGRDQEYTDKTAFKQKLFVR